MEKIKCKEKSKTSSNSTYMLYGLVSADHAANEHKGQFDESIQWPKSIHCHSPAALQLDPAFPLNHTTVHEKQHTLCFNGHFAR